MNILGVDESGFILTEVSAEKITSAFKPIVDHVLETIVHEFGPFIDGVYLYGSVATGFAVLGKSDLDAIIVFKAEPNPELLEQLARLETELTREYEVSLRGIGLETTYVGDVLSEKERYGGLCFLKHLCVCIYGCDLTKDVPNFKPIAEVARGFNGDIAQKLEILKSKIENVPTTIDLQKLSQSFAKKLVRTGFSLVMPRSASWTTDLDVAYQTFVKYYPNKSQDMATALNWAKFGSSDKQALIEFANQFGKWLAQEFQEVIP